MNHDTRFSSRVFPAGIDGIRHAGAAMSDDIRVGDVCVIVYMDRHPELVGRECIVRRPDGPKRVHLRSGGLLRQTGFGVKVPGWNPNIPGTIDLCCVPRAWLRKPRPPQPPRALQRDTSPDIELEEA